MKKGDQVGNFTQEKSTSEKRTKKKTECKITL